MLGVRNRGFLVRINERKKSIRKPRQVPHRHISLVPIRVPPLFVNVAKHGSRVVLVHKSTRTVIDRFTRNRNVIGIHDPMNEPHTEPLNNQPCLLLSNISKKVKIRVIRLKILRTMAQNRVVSKRLKRLNSARSRSIFKGTNTKMTGSNPSQHRSFFNSLPLHRFTRRNHRQRSSRGNTKMMHGFTNQIFAKHWTQGSSAIASPRKHSLPRPLQLNIPASAIRRKMFTEQNRSPITKH